MVLERDEGIYVYRSKGEKEIWGEEKPAILRTKKANTQEKIRTYLKDNPNASTRTIAKALKINQSTVSRNLKKK